MDTQRAAPEGAERASHEQNSTGSAESQARIVRKQPDTMGRPAEGGTGAGAPRPEASRSPGAPSGGGRGGGGEAGEKPGRCSSFRRRTFASPCCVRAGSSDNRGLGGHPLRSLSMRSGYAAGCASRPRRRLWCRRRAARLQGRPRGAPARTDATGRRGGRGKATPHATPGPPGAPQARGRAWTTEPSDAGGHPAARPQRYAEGGTQGPRPRGPMRRSGGAAKATTPLRPRAAPRPRAARPPQGRPAVAKKGRPPRGRPGAVPRSEEGDPWSRTQVGCAGRARSDHTQRVGASMSVSEGPHAPGAGGVSLPPAHPVLR